MRLPLSIGIFWSMDMGRIIMMLLLRGSLTLSISSSRIRSIIIRLGIVWRGSPMRMKGRRSRPNPIHIRGRWVPTARLWRTRFGLRKTSWNLSRLSSKKSSNHWTVRHGDNLDENIQLKNAQGKQQLNKNSSYSALNQLNNGNRND